MTSKPLHPKVKAVAKVAGALLALDAIIVGLAGNIPSPAVVGVLAIAHSVLPPLAGYLKSLD